MPRQPLGKQEQPQPKLLKSNGLERIFIRIVGLKSTAFIGGTFLVVQYLKKVPFFLEKVPLEIVTLKLQLYYKRFSD